MAKGQNIWFGGRIIAADDAVVTVLSPSVQYGLSAFEGIRGYRDADDRVRYFRLDDHLDRLTASCAFLGLEMPYARDQIASAIGEAVDANGLRNDVAVRVTVVVPDAGSWASHGPTELFVSPVSMPRKATPLTDGVSACVSSWQRIDERSMPPVAKVGANYINGRHAQLEARRNGYDAALMLNDRGTVAEAPGACFFMVRRGRIVTPPITASILESITRDSIVQLARADGLEAEEREVSRLEMYDADECFLCGSSSEVTPILSVDGRRIGGGAPGPTTVALHAAYLAAATGLRGDVPTSWTTMLPS